ncbi:MAG: 2,3-dihydroxybenzoate---[aryl-carrier protein] ligase, partial [Thermodesulfobacteriota bacterium]|nr:2,3-dihydroxybenzoate---[aryl-carrier protein] ligase [Thermodesulfobacteriota bacterium]
IRRLQVKPIRYTKEMVDEFLRDGYWTNETFYDFCYKFMAGIKERSKRKAVQSED